MNDLDKTRVRKAKFQEAATDFAFWHKQSYEKRLETLERIRQEYIAWKYGRGNVRSGFQRVYRVVKQEWS